MRSTWDLTKPHSPITRPDETSLLLQLHLDEIDKQKRFEEAQKPKGYVASGGLTGFRVATDLYNKHLTDVEADPESWRAPKPAKK